jgi:peroxiredoxin
LQLELINGDTIKYAQLRGQVLVTYFWASWCPFCAEQSPEIDKLFTNFQSKGLYVLGVSVDKDMQAAKTYLKKHNYRFPSTWLDPRGKTELQKPPGIPFVMVYNKSGQLVQQEKGQMFAEDVQALSRWINS